MEFHEITNLFPTYEEEAFLQLVADICAHGLLEPIVTYQGKVIDGRHRYLACKRAAIPPHFREWDGNGSLVSFVVSMNLNRRHLTSSQKAMVSLEVEKWLAKEALQRQQAAGRIYGRYKKPFQLPEIFPEAMKGEAREHAALLLGTNARYVTDAKKIAARAPELKEAVKEGKLTIPEAKKVAKLERAQREEVMHKLETGQATSPKAAILALKRAEQVTHAQMAPSKPSVSCACWQDWLPTQRLCDLLLTDPPYSTEMDDVESFAASWLPLALSKVKPTGRAYVFVGAYPAELFAYLRLQKSLPLPLVQILVWSYKNTLGPASTHRYKQNWQAILYFCGEQAPPLNCSLLTEQFSAQEISAPDGRQGERYHTWQKPDVLAELLIRHATRPGELVLDPFCGTGTFLLAAQRLGREGRGCDHSSEIIEIAQRRGCEIREPSASTLRAGQQSPA